MGDFFVQECCVHGTDLEIHGPASILCDDPIPMMTIIDTAPPTCCCWVERAAEEMETKFRVDTMST